MGQLKMNGECGEQESKEKGVGPKPLRFAQAPELKVDIHVYLKKMS